MSDTARNTPPEHMAETDRLNREIAQEARTDTELESIVPPISRTGNGWRIGVAVFLILAAIFLVSLFV